LIELRIKASPVKGVAAFVLISIGRLAGNDYDAGSSRPVGSEPVNDEKEDGQINRGSVESGSDKQIGKAQIFRCLLKQWYRPGLQNAGEANRVDWFARSRGRWEASRKKRKRRKRKRYTGKMKMKKNLKRKL
jgi:hypothetical protein